MSTDTRPADAAQAPEDARYDTGDTIAAIATPPGPGAVGIVRISGQDAFAAGMAMFRAAGPPASEPPPSHLLTYGHIVDPTSGEPIDEVLVAFMRAPRTYTCEDVVEINAHGGPLVLRRILALALSHGCRAARPGEMTLRAFLNGRLDLAQAEAVMALIAAESEAGRRLALRQLHGELSARVGRARQAALDALVRIEASIDFPEEEVPPPEPVELRALIRTARAEVDGLLAGADRGRLLREGLRVALVGRPNVGKSSLLNALLRTERAIVTPVAGTTRDTVEEWASVGGVPLHLIDTAGLSPSDDPIERLGVERSRAAAQSADLLLFVVDASCPLTPLDFQAAAQLRGVRAEADSPANGGAHELVLVLNKADLPQVVDEAQVREFWPGAALAHTCSLSSEGVAALEDAITRMTLGGETQAGEVLVSSARHQDALRRAATQLAAAEETLESGIALDFVSIDLRTALETLGEVTGETADTDLLDRIFSEFCIGK
jgi:tRNA modification GTPase